MKENGALAIGAVQKLKKEYCVEIRLQRTAFLIRKRSIGGTLVDLPIFLDN